MVSREQFAPGTYCACGLGSAWGRTQQREPRPPVERVRQGALILTRCTRCKKWRRDT